LTSRWQLTRWILADQQLRALGDVGRDRGMA
jgi:hypothetical protein